MTSLLGVGGSTSARCTFAKTKITGGVELACESFTKLCGVEAL